MERNVLEFVDHLHEHFLYPCSINQRGRYNVPGDSNEGYRFVHLDSFHALVTDALPLVSRCTRRVSLGSNGRMDHTGRMNTLLRKRKASSTIEISIGSTHCQVALNSGLWIFVYILRLYLYDALHWPYFARIFAQERNGRMVVNVRTDEVFIVSKGRRQFSLRPGSCHHYTSLLAATTVLHTPFTSLSSRYNNC